MNHSHLICYTYHVHHDHTGGLTHSSHLAIFASSSSSSMQPPFSSLLLLLLQELKSAVVFILRPKTYTLHSFYFSGDLFYQLLQFPYPPSPILRFISSVSSSIYCPPSSITLYLFLYPSLSLSLHPSRIFAPSFQHPILNQVGVRLDTIRFPSFLALKSSSPSFKSVVRPLHLPP